MVATNTNCGDCAFFRVCPISNKFIETFSNLENEWLDSDSDMVLTCNHYLEDPKRKERK